LVLVHLDLGRAELDARACTRGTQSLSAEMRHLNVAAACTCPGVVLH
jgi:hypothetical protein